MLRKLEINRATLFLIAKTMSRSQTTQQTSTHTENVSLHTIAFSYEFSITNV